MRRKLRSKYYKIEKDKESPWDCRGWEWKDFGGYEMEKEKERLKKIWQKRKLKAVTVGSRRKEWGFCMKWLFDLPSYHKLILTVHVSSVYYSTNSSWPSTCLLLLLHDHNSIIKSKCQIVGKQLHGIIK